MIDKTEINTNIKALTTNTDDVVINLMVDQAEQFILNYCKITEVKDNMFFALQKLAIYFLEMQGKSYLKSESLGDYSASFTENIPSSILSELNTFKRTVKYW